MKFTPSDADPHGDFADELYYPPEVEKEVPRFFTEDILYPSIPVIAKKKKSGRQRSVSRNNVNAWSDFVSSNDIDDGRALNEKSLLLNSFDDGEVIGFDHRPARNFRQNNYQRNYAGDADRNLEQGGGVHFQREAKASKTISDDALEFLTDQLLDNVANFEEQKPVDNYFNDNYEREFSRKYKYPNELWTDKNIPVTGLRLFAPDDEDVRNIDRGDLVDILESQLANEAQNEPISRQNGMYTEGGLVKPLKHANFKPGITQLQISKETFTSKCNHVFNSFQKFPKIIYSMTMTRILTINTTLYS